ncbi:MAG: arginine deiminase-related protein [Planctomycetes bacterium]|nr:arginine deiminase-related protein [Planctomycetota bacterium]
MKGVLLCPPDHFDVIDVKNVFMEGQAGKVDRARARQQWDALAETFRGIGLEVETLPPTPGCEDMVFAANPSFTGVNRRGRKVAVLSRMRHESRQREVEAHRRWFAGHGYDVIESPVPFEGGGDAVWHPGKRILWGGYGQRSVPEVYPFLAMVFGVEALTLELKTDFYHLDTCLCPLDPKTALVYPKAFTRTGNTQIRRHFKRVIEADEREARDGFACNALVSGKHVVIQRGSASLEEKLRQAGFTVHPVETGEFMKSGGSVYCMKQWLF